MFAVSMLVVTTTTVELTVATGIGTLRMSYLLRVYEAAGFTTIKDHMKSTHAHRAHMNALILACVKHSQMNTTI